MKQLIVNADDFGFTRDVNRGIVEAHQNGILTATTLMADGAAFKDAVALARETPTLDIGCHLVLVGDPPYPPTVGKLIAAIALGRVRIYEELSRQVRTILDAGITPTHLDTHKHTHLLPPVLDAVTRISEEFKIQWVRRPFDLPSTGERPRKSKERVARAMRSMRGYFRRAFAKHGCRSTDWFTGFRMTGDYDAAELAAVIRALPEGSTEFMCHPGLCTDELRAARTRLTDSREAELRALCAPEVRTALEESGVRLVRYGELDGP